MLKRTLFWVSVAGLGAVLLVLIAPFAQMVAICVAWLAQDQRSALVCAPVLMFALAPFVGIALIFRGSDRTRRVNR